MLYTTSNFKNHTKKLVSSFAFISLLFFSACDEYKSNKNTVTAVDGYIKGATIVDANGQKATYDGQDGKYTFKNSPAYPIQLTGGILEDTNEIFDIKMTASKGLVLSPITTFLNGDDALRQKLTDNGFSYIKNMKGFEVDYLEIDNLELAKLSQLLYVIMKVNLTDEFKTKINNSTSTLDELFTIAEQVIGKSTSLKEEVKVLSKDVLKSTKNYYGVAYNIEKYIEVEKRDLIYGYKKTPDADKDNNKDIDTDKNTNKKILTIQKPTLEDFIKSINEDIASGTPIGSISFDDGGSSVTSFTLNDTKNFEIADNGDIKTKGTFDFDKNNLYTLSLYANNAMGKSNTVDFKITIVEVISGTPVLKDFTKSIDEGKAVDRIVGEIEVLKTKKADITGYTLKDTTSFKIDNNGVITTKKALNFENKKVHNFSVYATSSVGDGKVANVTININNIGDTVPVLNEFSVNIAETTAKNTEIGKITFDKGDSDIESFTLFGADNTSFLVAKDGTVTTNATFDVKVKDSYALKIKATNNAGDSSEVNFTLNITPTEKKATLIDNVVEGVDYETDGGHIGTTDEKGKFTYDTKDSFITFKVGSLIIVENFDLSKLNNDDIILPADILGVDRTNTSNKNMIKILRVLQSLDDNSDPSDGIYINETTKGALSTSTKIIDNDISVLKTIVKNAGKKFRKQRKSREHYIDVLINTMHITPELMKFHSIWKTTSDSESITIATGSRYKYNYKIDWGDGAVEDANTGDATHTYASAGDYVVKISGKFPYIKAENNTKLQKISQWGDIAWSSFQYAFKNCSNLDITATDTPDLRKTKSLKAMFYGASKLKGNIYFNDWDVSKVESMDNMFQKAFKFNQPLNIWNVEKVKKMSLMFQEAKDFNQPLNSWNVSSVTSMYGMFLKATNFNGQIKDWNVGKVTTMKQMFSGASNFNQEINKWNVSNVSNTLAMFDSATAFNQELQSWDMRKVSDLRYMFKKASSFNQPLNNWNLENVKDMKQMFYKASSFNQPLNNWNTGKVTNMGEMFRDASAFSNQDLHTWKVTKVTNHVKFITGAGSKNIEPSW